MSLPLKFVLNNENPNYLEQYSNYCAIAKALKRTRNCPRFKNRLVYST